MVWQDGKAFVYISWHRLDAYMVSLMHDKICLDISRMSTWTARRCHLKGIWLTLVGGDGGGGGGRGGGRGGGVGACPLGSDWF